MKNAFWLFFTALMIFIVFWPSYLKIQDQKKELRRYERHIRYLQKQNKELMVERRKLKDDPLYLEQIAREKMGLVREGEMIIKIQPSQTQK